MGPEAEGRKQPHSALAPPRVMFAEREGAHIAYQVAGKGPPTIVYVAGSGATSLAWDDPTLAKGFRRFASFSRLVTYDQRGTGYSDRFDPSTSPTLEDLVADLEAVVEAAAVEDPVLFGTHNGGAVAAVYATRHAVRQLVLCNTWARLEKADDFPIGLPDRVLDRLEERYRTEWGEGRIYSQFAPRRQGEDPPGQAELASTSQNQLITIFRLNRKYDIRHLLPSVTAPTLVLHLEDNFNVPRAHGEYIAESIPSARLVLIPGSDHAFLRNYAPPVIDEVELFVTGKLTVFKDRVHTAILFTDIVDSTPLAASLGDEKWSALIDAHNERVRGQVVQRGGETLKSTGDGFLVAFDEPTAAIHCALSAMEAVVDLGLELRAGVHVGDVSPMGSRDLSGIAVHFAQRLCARASGGEVLVSAAVRDACADTDVHFAERGTAHLKGIPGEWEVFEAQL